MSFGTSAIKNPVVYFPYDLSEGRIRKQHQDATKAPTGGFIFDDVTTYDERMYRKLWRSRSQLKWFAKRRPFISILGIDLSWSHRYSMDSTKPPVPRDIGFVLELDMETSSQHDLRVSGNEGSGDDELFIEANKNFALMVINRAIHRKRKDFDEIGLFEEENTSVE
jgi:hypothetical protein